MAEKDDTDLDAHANVRRMFKVVERIVSVHTRNCSHVGMKLLQNLRSQFNLSVALVSVTARLEFWELDDFGNFVDSTPFRVDYGV